MKRFRKWAALIAVWGLLLTLWAPAVVSAEVPAPAAVTAPQGEELFSFGRSVLAKMDNGEALCYVYDRVVAGCQTMAATVDVAHRTHTVNADEAFLVWDTVVADHPEFFWLTSGAQIGGFGQTVTVFRFSIPKNAAEIRAELDDRVAELTAGLEGKSDYDKSRILHDRVCEAVVYQAGSNDQTVIGSLLEGAAVCAGYSRAYQLLLHTVGIPSFCITGASRGQAHAWNLVQLDSEWYYTDVTWDDQNDQGGAIYYAYLNNTFAQIEEDHTAMFFTEYLPRSTATANNYHVKNGLTLSAFNTNQVAAILRQGNPARIYVTGDMTAFINSLQNKLGDVVTQLVKNPYGYSCRMGYMGRELILSLHIDHTHTYKTETVDPTCTTEGTVTTRCTDCGIYTVETTPAWGHSHGWTTDDTRHTLRCERCGWVEQSGDHVYDGDKDADCNVCGYTREVSIATPGDADGNGKVNNRDLGRLQQFLNEWAVTVDPDACDLDGNGKVNNRDLGLLQRLLNE